MQNIQIGHGNLKYKKIPTNTKTQKKYRIIRKTTNETWNFKIHKIPTNTTEI